MDTNNDEQNLNSWKTPIIWEYGNDDVKAIDKQQKFFKETTDKYKEILKQRRVKKKVTTPDDKEKSQI